VLRESKDLGMPKLAFRTAPLELALQAPLPAEQDERGRRTDRRWPTRSRPPPAMGKARRRAGRTIWRPTRSVDGVVRFGLLALRATPPVVGTGLLEQLSNRSIAILSSLVIEVL
jgi:hypothetical protein